MDYTSTLTRVLQYSRLSTRVLSREYCHKDRVSVSHKDDAIEDTDYTTEDLFRKIEDTLRKLSTSEDEAWKEEFDIMPFPGDSMYFPSENDWQEMGEALGILNHHTAPNREEYINRFGENQLALKVKLNDMRNNMDISRIPSPTPIDYERLERYKSEYKVLLDMLPPIDSEEMF